MRVLALDAALSRCSAAVVVDDAVASVRQEESQRGHASVLPVLVDEALTAAGRAIDLVAVTVGPGGFTGLRAALSVAHGIALAAGRPIVGVTVGEALADSLPYLTGRTLWVAIDSRRGHVFLERNGKVESIALQALPAAPGPLAIAGDAAIEVAARLAARGDDVMLTDARLPLARHVAVVGRRRFAGELPPRPAQPLYVDPPAIRLPAVPPRPPPGSPRPSLPGSPPER
jgi:tRNA threonylcarbamoyl adenosine modification protein YeaZ